MTERNKKYIAYLAKVTATLLILYLLFREFHLGETLAIMSAVDPAFFIAGLATMLLAHVLNAYQFKAMMAPHGFALSTSDVFRINMIAKLYSLVIPGVLGGAAVRWYYLSRPDRKRAQAAAVVLFNRLLEITVVAVTGLFFWLVDRQAEGRWFSWENLMLLAGLLAFIYLLVFNARCHDVLRQALRTALLPASLREKLNKVFEAFALYRGCSAAFHARIFSICLARQFLVTLCIFLFATGLGIAVDYDTLGWIRAVVTLVLMFPVSVGGLGVREAGFAFFLMPYGVPGEAALALSLLIFVRSLLFSLLGVVFQVQIHGKAVTHDTGRHGSP